MSEGPTTATVLADYLVAAGIPYVFGYPGDPIVDFMEVSRRRGIEVILARREGTAAFMAEAYAMATGCVGTCLSTLGLGSTALVNGVAAATLDRIPMPAISGQIESGREQFFTHQVVDHGRLYGPITKWAGRIEPAAAATIAARGVYCGRVSVPR